MVIILTPKITNSSLYECTECGLTSIHAPECQFCLDPKNEGSVESMSKLTFVRTEKGDFVRSAVGVTKKIVEATMDVASAYADLLRGAMDLAIRVGWICFFWPYIVKFTKILFEAFQAGGGIGGF